MVARVDTVLREELGLADGLADQNVYVLDPCCGTGAYLVEVLRTHRSARCRTRAATRCWRAISRRRPWSASSASRFCPRRSWSRIFQLGLVLADLGAAAGDAHERGAALAST